MAGARWELQLMETWDMWFPGAAATGIPFARSKIQGTEVLLVHAAPPRLTATADTPITRLTRRGKMIVREDIWPEAADFGRVVILPGGEAGKLLDWWHAEDRSEWRWRVEFYNRVPKS